MDARTGAVGGPGVGRAPVAEVGGGVGGADRDDVEGAGAQAVGEGGVQDRPRAVHRVRQRWGGGGGCCRVAVVMRPSSSGRS